MTGGLPGFEAISATLSTTYEHIYRCDDGNPSFTPTLRWSQTATETSGHQSHGCASGSRLLQADEESLELGGEIGVPSNCIVIV